jgi:hypothetical protein
VGGGASSSFSGSRGFTPSPRFEAVLVTRLNFDWAGKDVDTKDPVEMELDGCLHMSVLAHVAGSTSRANVGPWIAFVFNEGL